MSKYFTMPGTDNVVDMRKYRTYKEAFRLFTHYKSRIAVMPKDELEEELGRLTKEKMSFPEHLLTKVKLQIFENATGIKV